MGYTNSPSVGGLNQIKINLKFKDESLFPGLEHFTIDIVFKYKGNICFLNSLVGEVKANKKTYKKVISFIPLYMFEENEFIIYRNIVEKMGKNKILYK